MKHLDRILQYSRMRRAARHLGSNIRVIDIGAHQGQLFHHMGSRLRAGFGIEPLLSERKQGKSYTLEPGFFPKTRPDTGDWDAITLLAVLEHIPREQHAALTNACHELLKAGGRVIITVPSPFVDHILRILKTFRLIDGMSLEEHFGFDPKDTVGIFAEPRFRLIRHERFQFGLNNLYVFEKRPPAMDVRAVV